MDHFTTIADVLRDQQERGLADLLLTVYDAGYCAGAHLPLEAPLALGLTDLLILLEARHRDEVLAPRGWIDSPRNADELPGWLLAHCERETALGDATAPDGWQAVAVGGKP